jgi:molybdopterin converting factor small subunit
MPQVKIPPPYRGPTSGKAVIDVEGVTVRACIESVEAQHPGFCELVFDAEGKLQRFVTLFINGDEIGRDDSDAPVAADDVVDVLAAIAGG